MISAIYLQNFKAFERFRVTVKGDAFLVGPNNAGKSTVIAALRSVASMVRIALRERAAQSFEVDGFQQVGYWFTGLQVGLVDENLRHEFHQVETRIKVKFKTGAVLEAVWPIDEEDGFFFMLDKDGVNLMQLGAIRQALPSVGVVPVLMPLDHSEELLSEKYVRSNLDGRLASRHFRNQLYLLEQEPSSGTNRNRLWDFKEFASPWIGELELADLQLRRGNGQTSFDLNYQEPGSRIPKEVFWAGDGMQIWLQLLLHLFRQRDKEVVVLDEPDVFLHSDLQRRLVNLLESLPAQSITATHSAEVIAEAADESIIWVSRERKSAIRAPRKDVLLQLSATLGTQFNLRLAKALKTKVAVFVEGKDAKVLRNLAKTLEHDRIHRERGITIIPMGGFENWSSVTPFKWLIDEFLEEAVVVYVILDRDFRSDEVVESVRKKLRRVGAKPHVWRRNELENYLLDPGCLARVSGADEAWINATLDEAAVELEDEVYAEVFSAEAIRHKGSGKSAKTISQEGKARADEIWQKPERRLEVCGGKELLRFLNQRLQEAKKQAVTDRGLSSRLRTGEIPREVRTLLASIEEDAVA